MNTSAKFWLVVACVAGALGVVLGAFGAHGVPSFLEDQGYDAATVASRLEEFETAARYHLYGALFLLGVALVADRVPGRATTIAGWTMLAGMLVFCGAVYAVALVPPNLRSTFGMMAPIGGTLMIAGWVSLAFAARGGSK
ncbi:DUF423 domain-containing protein [Aeoliella sp. SH292]|uniref:DUF423 domain-containing protein n=1 Tax=Aeoliella sp. SH292 TaxID=3454464 RepID=UPI003F9E3DE7